jgi:1,4-dihydroxy-2-naphthoate octaprenyltransferase
VSQWMFWIKAARLRTLPLAFSGVLLGNVTAYIHAPQRWSALIFFGTIYTILLLQILSNFANDYGDGVKGTDQHRSGPARAVASGWISPHAMRLAIFLLAFMSLLSGLALLYYAVPLNSQSFLILLLLGLLAIISAIVYTVGRYAFGYRGLGDMFVFLFFGPVAVIGSCYLQCLQLVPYAGIGGIAMGLLSAGVLNLNNIRDIETDKAANKITLAVRLGKDKAWFYHFVLVGGGYTSLLMWFFQYGKGIGLWIPLLVIQVLLIGNTVLARVTPDYNRLLARLAMSTFIGSLLSLMVL